MLTSPAGSAASPSTPATSAASAPAASAVTPLSAPSAWTWTRATNRTHQASCPARSAHSTNHDHYSGRTGASPSPLARPASNNSHSSRSEERRVGKECRARRELQVVGNNQQHGGGAE